MDEQKQDRNLIIISLGLQKVTASLRFDLTLFLYSFMETFQQRKWRTKN
uniref:Uncharacterized protein n=1 Tax=Wuchereria bancrofti TaxID=6293 RepID=A0AAF5Q0W6_WUCBA